MPMEMALPACCVPGFAWSNFNGGAKNQIPRNKGEFMWRQIYNIKSLNMPGVYIAMFDEYDEGTAILKYGEMGTAWSLQTSNF